MVSQIRARNRWPFRRPKPSHRTLLTVDGIACPYKEVRLWDGDLDPSLFCQKFKGPGLNYQIVLGLYTGLLCSVQGPYECGDFPDLKIAKDKGLVDFLIQKKEKAIADGTYRNPVFINAEEGLPQVLLKLISKARARHETVNSRIKRCKIFTCLRGFRHDKEFHGTCFHAVCNMIEIEFEIESPLFDVIKEARDYERAVRHHR